MCLRTATVPATSRLTSLEAAAPLPGVPSLWCFCRKRRSDFWNFSCCTTELPRAVSQALRDFASGAASVQFSPPGNWRVKACARAVDTSNLVPGPMVHTRRGTGSPFSMNICSTVPCSWKCRAFHWRSQRPFLYKMPECSWLWAVVARASRPSFTSSARGNLPLYFFSRCEMSWSSLAPFEMQYLKSCSTLGTLSTISGA
mmetsp:Transcript_40742/g.59852  ORF Transcript_40742/g.59852 Transcript_40742/m.59852 type:complete len:200 (-) Transcript_40742:189-788(-)